MEGPGRLQSMGSLSWTRLSDFTFTHWRRQWQPTPVFLPGESQGWGSLVGCCLWGRPRLKWLSSSKVGPVVCVSFVWGEICAEFVVVVVVVVVFPLMHKAEWGGHPICWWLGLYFCLVCCLDEASCTGCYWWLGNAGSCIPVVSFVWVFTIWYSLGLVLWWSRVLESVLPLQRLRAWSLVRNEDSTSSLLWH